MIIGCIDGVGYRAVGGMLFGFVVLLCVLSLLLYGMEDVLQVFFYLAKEWFHKFVYCEWGVSGFGFGKVPGGVFDLLTCCDDGPVE